MSIPKFLIIGAVSLFAIIGGAAYIKKMPKNEKSLQATTELPKAATPLSETPVISIKTKAQPEVVKEDAVLKKDRKKQKNTEIPAVEAQVIPSSAPVIAKDDFPTIDRVFQLFTPNSSKLPIVETINYSSSASWLKGRPAWIADYATHFGTSRHFIARSLNGKADYFTQKVFEGSKFNVFRKDKQIEFYLLVDVSRLKMGFYYVDLDTKERVLLKTYRVGLGRLEPTKPSGTLTPLGRYALGDRVAIYKTDTISYFQDKKTEMIRFLGTRWIPFDREVERSTAPAKGFGIYGAPWTPDSKTGQWTENKECIGKYDTDGGIRMAADDLEELFAIVITKPTYVEIVTDFHQAKLPGIEVATPTR